MDAEGRSTIAVGSEVSLTVIEFTPSGVHLGTSLRKALGTPGRELLQRAYEADLPVEGMILKVNKGGLEVDIGGARAFCPLSQIDLHYCENPEALVGTNQKFQVLRIEEEGQERTPLPPGRAAGRTGIPGRQGEGNAGRGGHS